jgi:hypothetical protein
MSKSNELLSKAVAKQMAGGKKDSLRKRLKSITMNADFILRINSPSASEQFPANKESDIASSLL